MDDESSKMSGHILFVGMDAKVLKIPDYDTPENWILLRYIRDEL